MCSDIGAATSPLSIAMKALTKCGEYRTMTMKKKTVIIGQMKSVKSWVEVTRELSFSKQTFSYYTKNRMKTQAAAEMSTGLKQKNWNKSSHLTLEEAHHRWLSATFAKVTWCPVTSWNEKQESLRLKWGSKSVKLSEGWLWNFKEILKVWPHIQENVWLRWCRRQSGGYELLHQRATLIAQSRQISARFSRQEHLLCLVRLSMVASTAKGK